MCGISGIIGLHSNEDSLQKMLNSIENRGPDSNGMWFDENKTVGLAHTRLSIMDLSSRGHQPMVSSTDRFVITFNGEIYNFIEIKKELELRGIVFSTNSDTEVILGAWEVWGLETIEKLRGMFAFAIWDKLDEKLILVRDRFGIKPVLYGKTAQNFVFGSTLSSILASGLVQPILNNQAFFEYLGYGSVFQPNTMIEGIESLMPGHYLIFQKGRTQIHRYWKLERKSELSSDLKKLSGEELILRTRLMLEESCKYHLLADVPIGSFLSGGVDSTAITALMAKNSGVKIKTFSVGFETGKDFSNELNEARLAAHYLNTDHCEVFVTGKDVLDNFEDFITLLDQPSIDGLNTFFVSRAAKNQVKVALSGLGSDEIFAGYDHFSWPNIYSNYSPTLLDKLGFRLHSFKPTRFTHFSFLACQKPDHRLSLVRQQFSKDSIYSLISDNLVKKFSSNYMEKYIDSLGLGLIESVNDISMFEIHNYLPNTLLRDSDSLGMGNGVEVRPPFLDHKLVEFAMALPDDMKWNGGVGKFALKEATKDLLPPNFFKTKKKGFTLPISRWTFSDLKKEIQFVLNDNYSHQFISQIGAKRMLGQLESKTNGWQLYQVFVFLKWAKTNKIYIN
jgi:asparagine synthase (glutamine-hydrolysing)